MNPARAAPVRRQLELAFYYLFGLRRKRTYWEHEIYKSRRREGEYHKLMPRLRAVTDEFFNYFRLDEAAFDKLIDKIRPRFALRSCDGSATWTFQDHKALEPRVPGVASRSVSDRLRNVLRHLRGFERRLPAHSQHSNTRMGTCSGMLPKPLELPKYPGCAQQLHVLGLLQVRLTESMC